MANDDLVFYVKLHVKSERVDEWRQAVEASIERMSTEPEFVACYLHRDSQDACEFTLYERWREPSVEAFLRNQMKPYRIEYDARLPDLLARPREAAILKPLGEWIR